MVKIRTKISKKIFKYAKRMDDKEIGGLLLGEVVNDEIIINDAILLKQKVDYANFEIDDDDMMEFTKNSSDKVLASVIGWWHSHGKGGTFWSDNDDSTFKRLCKFFGGYCIGVVVSTFEKGNEKYKVRVETKKGQMLDIDDIIPEKIDEFMDFFDKEDISKTQKKEVEEKVISDFDDNFYNDDELLVGM